MTDERKQLGILHHVITTYLCQNHVQGEELVVVEGMRDELLGKMKAHDSIPESTQESLDLNPASAPLKPAEKKGRKQTS